MRRKGTAKSLERLRRELTDAGLDNARWRLHAPDFDYLQRTYGGDKASALLSWIVAGGRVRLACNEMGT